MMNVAEYEAGNIENRPPQKLPRVFARITTVTMIDPPMSDLIRRCFQLMGYFLSFVTWGSFANTIPRSVLISSCSSTLIPKLRFLNPKNSFAI